MGLDCYVLLKMYRSHSSFPIEFDSIEPIDIWKNNDESHFYCDKIEPIPISMLKSGAKSKRVRVDENQNKVDEVGLIDTQAVETLPASRKRRKKPNGMPKRPLSAYNLFFRAERAKILIGETMEKDDSKENGRRRRPPHGIIGFSDLGKCIGARWKNLSFGEKKKLKRMADEESERYKKEMKEYKEREKKQKKVNVIEKSPTPEPIEPVQEYFPSSTWHPPYVYAQEKSSYPLPSFQYPSQLNTVTMLDANNIPKSYYFCYAAVPVPREIAEQYMKNSGNKFYPMKEHQC